MNNKRGMTPLGIILVDIVFLVVWSMFASDIFKNYGLQAIENGATGAAAFGFANLNFIVLLFFVIANVAYLYYGST